MASYWRNGEPNWRRLEAMARRGWGRFQSMADDELGQWGGNFRIGRMLAAGDVRLVALYFIEQQPRHGYDLIKAIEERSAGFYAPSPGVVYPALTFLEEAGYVTSAPEGNRKLYTITEEGRAHLADNREAVGSTLDFLAQAGEKMSRLREFARADWPFSGPAGEGNEPPHRAHRHERGFGDDDRPLNDATPELERARKALKQAIRKARRGDEAQQRRAADILRRAAAEVDALGEDDVDL